MKQPFKPSRILMLKSHSAGIGDVLRGSAAWRVLKNAWPEAELHLLLFSREPGYPSEELIRDHHLLASFGVVDKRTNSWQEWRRFWADVHRAIGKIRADLIVDFEPSGLRTSLVAAWFSRRWGARTVGINTVPGRNLFYSRASVAPKKYALQRGLSWPLEYTQRDFVALSALGLEREGCPIEVQETDAGHQARQSLLRNHGLAESTPLLGLNIGCGTPGASDRRPNIALLSELATGLQRDHGMRLVLTGAPFERATNQEFAELHRQKFPAPIIDLAGETSISGLTGAINACTLFISGDTGPYHIAVGLGVPTLAIFNNPHRTAYHTHPWVRCCVATAREQLPALRLAAEELLDWRRNKS
ncbi:MAG TPA: glycosyltransferase family 9 protein [Verrucomicrobiae bacterium]|nr:glycosyltransferase family 9 protein [Verrucomicrobiae bacterium]